MSKSREQKAQYRSRLKDYLDCDDSKKAVKRSKSTEQKAQYRARLRYNIPYDDRRKEKIDQEKEKEKQDIGRKNIIPLHQTIYLFSVSQTYVSVLIQMAP
eukprot:1632743-Ditylum_brightwellii.AAC.1